MAAVETVHDDARSRYESRTEGELARFALDDVRTTSTRRVLPVRPSVQGWIGRHREYADPVCAAPAPGARDAGRPR